MNKTPQEKEDQLFTLADEKISHGMLAEGISIYQSILADNPGNVPAMNNMGLALISQRQYDEAVAVFIKAIALAPNVAPLHYNLGLGFHKIGKLEQAIASYRKAVSIDPNYKNPLQNLGAALKDTGALEEAALCFRKLLEFEPGNQDFLYMLDALTAQGNHETAPREYVAKLFDEYAGYFEDQLVQKLEYRTPMVLRQRFAEVTNGTDRFDHMLDLGCGTGMAGNEFSAMVQKITGVDLSLKMLEQARLKNLYSVLTKADIIDFLQQTPDSYDLVVASDVLVYMGRLDELFSLLGSRMTDKAYLLFSTENSPCPGSFSLLPTGRYGHDPLYIQDLALKNRFLLRLCQNTKIRKERDQWIRGNIYVLQLLKE